MSPPAYFQIPGMLVDEALLIESDFGLDGAATLRWNFDPANATGLGGSPIDSPWRCDGETPLGMFAAGACEGVVTISGVNDFSTWYIGNSSAVPVSVSEFQVEQRSEPQAGRVTHTGLDQAMLPSRQMTRR